MLGLLLLSLLSSSLQLDSMTILIDAEKAHSNEHIYATFQEAAIHFIDGTSERPMTVYIAPGVYWIDDPDDNTVKVGSGGREPFGMVVRCQHLHLIGLSDDARKVVLASQRGQTQGAVGNFTMFDFWGDGLQVSNLTMGNFCNVDLEYPYDTRLNRKKRSSTITQAHVGYVHGDSLIARNVRFISRLNLNPLNGAHHSVYENCHFECTDDALNGAAIYRHCDFDLYGAKPFWSTHGSGAMFVDCDFNVKTNNRDLYFCKQGGPVTVINSRYHAPSDSIYIGWTPYPQPWLRCYQQGFTLNGRPYLIGSRNPQNTVILNKNSDFIEGENIPYLSIRPHHATLRTGDKPAMLICDDREKVQWQVEEGFDNFVSLDEKGNNELQVKATNNSDESVDFCIFARTADGRQAASHLVISPSLLAPPRLLGSPHIIIVNDSAKIDYRMDLQGRRDETDITWLRDGIPVSVSRELPVRSYRITSADTGKRLSVMLRPKHHRSDYGDTLIVSMKSVIPDISQHTSNDSILTETDFHDFPCQWQPLVSEGYWTVDGHKPSDTDTHPWSFSRDKPMWDYQKGFNGAVGMGLVQAQRGARLMYTPVGRDFGNVSLRLDVDPTKTAGQGFGSATAQYMDVCLKFDTHSLTGYGLRIERTVKHAKAVDFSLVEYRNGKVSALTAPVSATCYRTGCSIFIDFTDGLLTADVRTKTPRPTDSALPHEVHLSASVPANPYGGVHIQHTGTCGESTTMLHRLQLVRKR